MKHKEITNVTCGKKFTQSGSLNAHIKTTHEELRNYKCDSYGKFFTQSGNLKEHTKIVHEGQKNFKCNYCGKSFGTPGNLNMHIKTTHKEQKNTIVILVENYSLNQEIPKDT